MLGSSRFRVFAQELGYGRQVRGGGYLNPQFSASLIWNNHHVLHVPYLLDGLSSDAGSDVRRMVRIDRYVLNFEGAREIHVPL